jgi:hypothetical protein
MISKIFVSGGSHCIGGGFNWEDVVDVYRTEMNINIENRFDITYPKLVGNYFNSDVIFKGEFGGSINRMIRKTYEYIFNNNVADTLFILEVPPGWRDEFYSNELNRNVNMTIGNILSPDDNTDVANGNDVKDLHKIHKDITNYFYNFIDYEIDKRKWMYNLVGLLSYFQLHKLKYIVMDNGDLQQFLKSQNKSEDDYNLLWFDKGNSLNNWINENGLTIKLETNNKSNDEHLSIKGHQMVAEKIINYVKENKSSFS